MSRNFIVIDRRQDPNRLQLPADDGTNSQTSASLKGVTPAARTKRKGIFTKKGVKVQAWKGPQADYETPSKAARNRKVTPKVTHENICAIFASQPTTVKQLIYIRAPLQRH